MTYYAQLDEAIAIPLPFPLADGQIKVDHLTDYAPQFNIGILLKHPSRNTRLGIAYRPGSTFNLKGISRFFGLSTTPSIKAQIKLAQNITASMYHPLSNRVALVADLGWANWKTMSTTPITISGLSGVNIPRNWKDTWRAGIGGAI